jgi:DNA invertase Pin-like site-specific DNA recombinase
MTEKKIRRCAVYTRKSTEEGLDQEFNSLDAQREACEAYVASQVGLGWKLIRTQYDDGGLSGGTMDRPALRQLLNDIQSARVDVVVVYKIDRLTRSLMDFAKIVDVFDAHRVSFVSVTQQFNTTTSMGRLTLNVLLSFAQFEREVTAERIRDKIAASKKKGMWMGGPPPLGLDVRDKRLVVNEVEALTVRRLFDLYLQTKSVRQLKALADDARIVTKRRLLPDGRFLGGKRFSRGNLYQLLSNPIYVGNIAHKGQIYPGLHDAVVDRETWDAVQAVLSSNAVDRHVSKNVTSPCILTGLVFDETGDRLTPSHAVKAGVRYRYYVSHRLMNARKADDSGWRLPVKELEQPVLAALAHRLGDDVELMRLLDLDDLSPHTHRTISINGRRLASELRSNSAASCKSLLRSFVERVEMRPDLIRITICVQKLIVLLGPRDTSPTEANAAGGVATIDLPHRLKRRGVEARLIVGNGRDSEPRPNDSLITLIVKAHRWLDQLTNGNASSITELAAGENEDRNEISRYLPLAFLAPDIVENILRGTQPVDLTVEKLRRIGSLPHQWDEQRAFLGFAD